MAIDSSLRCCGRKNGAIFALVALVLLTRLLPADDQIQLKAGTTISGQITGVSDGQVLVNVGSGKSVVYLTDIKSVSMAPPATLAALKGAAPEQVVTTLAPLVQKFAGLPADWVLDAMGNLADAYDAQGQAPKAAAVYAQINQLYPRSPYQKMAVVGQARIDIKAGRIDAALAALGPMIAEANKNIAPSPAEGRLFAGAFLAYGQALEAQKAYAKALEAYLTVKTMFYQNPALVAQAETQARDLLAKQPGTGVD